MNVGFFTDTWLPNKDGVVVSMLAHRRELERRGNKVFVFTSGDKARDQGKRVFVHTSIVVPPYPQYRLAVFPFITVHHQVKQSRLDLVHCHAVASMGLAAIQAGKEFGLPLVGSFHTMLPRVASYLTDHPLGQRFLSQATWKAIELFYKPFDLVLTPSHTIRKALNEHGVKKVSVVPNGIDAKRFNPRAPTAKTKKKLGVGNKKVVLVAGRLGLEKNVDVVLKAAPLVLKKQKALFVVAGKGPAKEKLERLVKQKGLEKDVVFAGFVPDKDLASYYAASDVFVTASTFETQGLVLFEAMACGTPCVGARSLAVPEAVRDGETGYLFKPFDEKECARKILRVLQAPARERTALSRNARAFAEQFTVSKSTDLLLEAYEKVL